MRQRNVLFWEKSKKNLTNAACIDVTSQWYPFLQGKLSKPSALHGRGSGMFYLTVRCRGGGMAAGLPAVIDIFSSFEGRKGNSSA